jgi:hypothetical protein
VYNIEVDGDHCYRVGRQGLLVHNASVFPATEAECQCDSAVQTSKYVFGPTGKRFTVLAEVVPDTENKANPEVCRVLHISGPLDRQSGRGSQLPQTAMRKFLLDGEPSLQKGFAAGHAIADTNGGPNTTWNLVPMAHQFNNQGGWKSMELRIGACLGDPAVKKISMAVALTYPKTGLYKHVPDTATVTLTMNGKTKKPIIYSNTQVTDPRNFAASNCLADW